MYTVFQPFSRVFVNVVSDIVRLFSSDFIGGFYVLVFRELTNNDHMENIMDSYRTNSNRRVCCHRFGGKHGSIM